MAWPGELPFAGMSSSSTAMPTAPAYPNLFVTPPFVSQPLSSSLNLSAEDGGTTSAFTMEDRMLLRLMYNQQQIIQVQLNTIFSWMQLTNNKLAHLERSVQERDGQTHRKETTQKSLMTASTAPPPLRGVDKPCSDMTSKRGQDPAEHASVTAIYPAHTQGHASPSGVPQTCEVAPSANAGPPRPTSAHPTSVATSATVATHAGHSDGLRSCTPPTAELEPGSCNQSMLNHSVDSIAPPWDPRTRPTNVTGGHLSSLRSSRGSQLGRQDNPLLSSLQQQGEQQQQHKRDSSHGIGGNVCGSNTAAVRSTLQSVQRPGSTRSLRSTSQADATAAPQSEPRPQSERAVPPYRRVAVNTAAVTTSLAATTGLTAEASPDTHRVTALLTRRTHHPATEARRSRTGSALTEQEADLTARPLTPSAPPRAATPPLSEMQGTDNPSEDRGRDAERGLAAAHAGSAARESFQQTSPMVTGGVVGDAASQHTRVYNDAALPQRRRMSGGNDFELRDYDSLSDGYGSYESKQYLRSNGLL